MDSQPTKRTNIASQAGKEPDVLDGEDTSASNSGPDERVFRREDPLVDDRDLLGDVPEVLVRRKGGIKEYDLNKAIQLIGRERNVQEAAKILEKELCIFRESQAYHSMQVAKFVFRIRPKYLERWHQRAILSSTDVKAFTQPVAKGFCSTEPQPKSAPVADDYENVAYNEDPGENAYRARVGLPPYPHRNCRSKGLAMLVRDAVSFGHRNRAYQVCFNNNLRNLKDIAQLSIPELKRMFGPIISEELYNYMNID